MYVHTVAHIQLLCSLHDNMDTSNAVCWCVWGYHSDVVMCETSSSGLAAQEPST